MADFTEVANALVTAISAVVYPNGTAAPSTVTAPVKIFQGWPLPETLRTDLKAGKIHVSVFPTPTERALPSHAPEWEELTVNDATVTLAIDGYTVTIGGTAAANQNVMLLIDGEPYVYAVQASDTLTAIATALATLISADRAASSVGPVLTVPDTFSVTARVGVQGTSIRELRRQEKVFQISVWANCHDQRDPLAIIVDRALAGTYRLTFSDGSKGMLRYRSSIQHDDSKLGIYRRDMLYAVEYSLTETSTDTQVVTAQTATSSIPLEFDTGTAIGEIVINS
ncbi:MAG: hypothetical protein A3I66_01415 [Burkholderiales bacterium RIFCSPLOWO2_02_FULL_57_36]|nr:MAG: hypothetical protein A3I66_01415 [Burkholderiales bacterium RIFCSPLOWO2_02_FULL_57_36]